MCAEQDVFQSRHEHEHGHEHGQYWVREERPSPEKHRRWGNRGRLAKFVITLVID